MGLVGIYILLEFSPTAWGYSTPYFQTSYKSSVSGNLFVNHQTHVVTDSVMYHHVFLLFIYVIYLYFLLLPWLCEWMELHDLIDSYSKELALHNIFTTALAAFIRYHMVK